MHKIRKATVNKPCSCPPQKICTGCKQKLPKPQVYVEEPHRIPVPIVIKKYKEKPIIVQHFDRRSRWHSRRKKPTEEINTPEKKTNKFCQWYTRRRALKELKTLHQKELKRERECRLEKARRERETEFMEQLRQKRSESLPPPKIERKLNVKARSASVKPRAASRYVTVQRYNRYESLTSRFVNCFYRFCCQFYCYLTCIIALTLFIYVII